MSELGTVYLLHFSRPYRHARHYVGWTGGEPGDRLQAHLSGRGSPLVRAAARDGVDVVIARLWPESSRSFERWLKNLKGIGKRACPLCLGRIPRGSTNGNARAPIA